jgi:hypothetical protein
MLEAGFPQIVKIAKFFVKLLEEYFYYFFAKIKYSNSIWQTAGDGYWIIV